MSAELRMMMMKASVSVGPLHELNAALTPLLPLTEAGATTSGSGGGGGEKVKAGFGRFMNGLDKWANKTADSMAKQMEKVGIKD